MKYETKVFAIFVVISLLLMTTSVLVKGSRDRNSFVKPNSVEVQGVNDYSTYPAIVNIAPNNVIVGSLYRYDLSIVDSDSVSNSIKVEIVEGPDWLKVDGKSILGIPKANNLGQSKVVIKVSDEKQSIFSTFYIFVKTVDEK